MADQIIPAPPALRRDAIGLLVHVVVPVLGMAAFVPAWLTAAGIQAFSFVTPLQKPVSYMGPAVGVWMATGAICLVWLYVRHPARVADVSRVHLDEEPGAQAPAPDRVPAA
jgi:hypothetical protein